VKLRLAERTYENYRQYAEYYIQPGIGRIRVSDIRPSHLQGFYSQLLRSGRRRKLPGIHPGLSSTTVNNIHRVLHDAFAWAIKWQIISENPTDRVAVPKASAREQVILSPDQIATILRETTDERIRLMVMIGVCTGMRRGEILGLRWNDVDLAHGILAIRHSLVDTGRRVVSKEPKTATGSRPLMMPSVLTEFLRDHRRVQRERKSLLGSAYQENDLVVCWEDGRPLHPHRVYRPLRNLLNRLGLPAARLHDLRHSHATHLLCDGVHPKTVSERLGHKDVETTLNLYSHLLPHIQREAAEATDKSLREAIRGGKKATIANE
jgi:integrase